MRHSLIRLVGTILSAALMLTAATPAQARARWVVQYGTDGYDDTWDLAANGYGISQVGGTSGAFPGYLPGGSDDVFVQRFDRRGAILWVRQFGGGGYEVGTGVAVQGRATYVAGVSDTGGPGAGDSFSFLRRYSAAGDLEWGRTFGAPDVQILSVASTQDAVYIGGSMDPPPGSGLTDTSDAVVIRYSADGERSWLTSFGSHYFDSIEDVAVTDEGVFVVGNRGGAWPTPLQDAFVARLDPDGQLRWTSRLGGPGTQDAEGIAVGDVVFVTGSTSVPLEGQPGFGEDDGFLVTYGLDGRRAWTREFGTDSRDVATAIALRGPRIAVAGYTGGAFPGQVASGRADAFVVTFRADGRLRGSLQFGTAEDESVSGLAVRGAVYVGGHTYGELGTKVGPYYGSDAFLAAFGRGEV